MNKYIGIDIGTTMIKGQLLDESGFVVASKEFSSPTYSKDGVSYLDAIKSKEYVFEIIKHLTSSTKDDAKAICFSCLGEAFVLVDKNGKPVHDFILFVSDLGEKECNALLERMESSRICQISGAYPNKMYSFSKLMYLKNEKPEVYERGHKMLMFAPYMNFNLTGKYSCDYSLGARTLCLDISKKVWSKEIIKACDLDIELFPKLYKADEVVGYVKPDVAKELGLPNDCTVLASGHDQMMAAIGSGLNKTGMANDGTGTAECMTVVFDKIPEGESFYKNNLCVVPYLYDNTYLTYAFISTGGALLKWHRDYLSPLENKECEAQGKDYYATLSSKEINLPTSLLILPHFAGSGTPYMNSESTGAILGLTQETTKDEIYFSLMEAATYEIKLNLSILKKERIEVKTISATGGGAKAPVWLKIKSNIYNRKIRTLYTPEGGIYGCFILINKALGIYDNYDIITNKFIKFKSLIKPEKLLTKKYSENYKKYIKVYKNICKIWR